ncbi:hypothetical protein MAR_019384 [Mya arenaria]|uniref:Uncharacterized protein n=1 Tax=Mya arenaria TaxID=6604 RepID=A0ABY7EL04_MYAAR|nr:hypothetical protein MAR_019384 [Mya arenaria]
MLKKRDLIQRSQCNQLANEVSWQAFVLIIADMAAPRTGNTSYVDIPGIIVTPRHRQQRERWARRHQRMLRIEWFNILFTAESRLKVFYNDGRMQMDMS